MKKFLLAGLLAVTWMALTEHHAVADCYNLAGSFHLKVCYSGCLKAWKEACAPCNPCCPDGGGGGGCWAGRCGDPSGLIAPGPWYLWWPYADAGYQSGPPAAFPGWNYS